MARRHRCLRRINDALSELLRSHRAGSETFNKMERTLPDKEVGRKLRRHRRDHELRRRGQGHIPQPAQPYRIKRAGHAMTQDPKAPRGLFCPGVPVVSESEELNDSERGFPTTSGPVIRSCIRLRRRSGRRGIALPSSPAAAIWKLGCWSITRGFQQKFEPSRAAM